VASLQLAGMGPSYAVQGYLAGKNETGASAVLLVGIAFGIDSAAQKHGDVLVSQRVLPCDERNVTARQRAPADPTWLPEWDYDFRAPAIEASPTLTRRVEIGAKSDNWTIDFGIHAGTLLSGGARIESSLYLLHLLRCASGFAPIIGGDMETAILASLARNDEIDWITIKGISDFAEESRNN
jgi:nucleoside phosphorylase